MVSLSHACLLYVRYLEMMLCSKNISYSKELKEQSRECHNHTPQPTPDTKRREEGQNQRVQNKETNAREAPQTNCDFKNQYLPYYESTLVSHVTEIGQLVQCAILFPDNQTNRRVNFGCVGKMFNAKRTKTREQSARQDST